MLGNAGALSSERQHMLPWRAEVGVATNLCQVTPIAEHCVVLRMPFV